MDLIIRFNPSTENQLIKKQKEILFRLNSTSEKSRFFPNYPILCPLNAEIFSNKNAHDIKKIITALSIKQLKLENSEIYFSVEIQTENSTAEEKILIGTAENNAVLEVLEDTNLKCRSFQIAELKKTGFTYEIWNPVWCKLK